MNATRKQRLWLVIGVLAAAALAGTLIVFALQRNMSYLFTPSQVHAGEAAGYQQFRLGGMVKAGSIQRASDSLKVSFTVIDKHAATQVEYTGILPDLFRDNQSVIANGRMQGGRFVANEVLAKHDETYMPKELKDAMAEGHVGKPIAATAMPLSAPR
ncbi:cytochrome c maturation protein CcmE [Xanthomonas cannabis]|uniref:cytochrome c maturation protein CcmE n=1 Tax=Xanthomonas cannabis TaxID=1885674 RepID=UPI00141B0FC4|nr:cytochrome c maturation protein CcmE [Xanthomonas cannabis]NIK01589.1 cytochrome c-type biogenesis protein CcmE [Xanthomonas cannabis]